MKNKFIGIALAMMMVAGMIVMPVAHAEEAAVDDVAQDEAAVIEELAAEDAKINMTEENVAPAEGSDSDAEKDDDGLAAPTSVKNVDAKAKGRGKTKLKWTPAPDADGYYILRASKMNGEYKVCKKIGNGKAAKCTDKYKKLRKNKKYYYKVYAYKADNGSTVISEGSDKDSAKNTLSYKKKIKMKATAYSGGGSCANGKRCKVGRVAVDPDVIPLGTWLYVTGYGFCQACDTGGAIKGNRIDLYFNSEGDCSSYGVRSVQVFVLRK